MKAPQIIWLILVVLNVGISLAKHGEDQPEYNFWHSLIGSALGFGLLYWGGFFAS